MVPSPASKASKKNTGGIIAHNVDNKTLQKRQNRFASETIDEPPKKKAKKQAKSKSSAEISYASRYVDDINQGATEFDPAKMTVVGTCRKVEKEVMNQDLFCI